jgi:hypothetical protein
MVTLQDVLRWLGAALEAAQNDPGDGDGTTTATSNRRLQVRMRATPGHLVVEVTTDNYGFSGSGLRWHVRTTVDGAEVAWDEGDIGIPTGADWLPPGFVEWMKGGEV